VHAVENCKVCELAIALCLLVITICKCSKIQLPTPSVVTHTCDNIYVYSGKLDSRAVRTASECMEAVKNISKI
jgi:hypothetical protein